ncbi:MAG: tRNA lysidine(34) synthetase TilS [Acidipila sp.]|nr:tRNA lysidine(34) synthetase TilS [Acidipila sp.]
MKTALQRQVLEAIERRGMISPGDRVGIAVSGGADSVALLRLLELLRVPLGISVVVLHFHHGLRGVEADADQKFVEDLARELGLEFLAGGEDVQAWATAHHRNLEDAGRHLRYAFFQRCVDQGRATRVAVAHTADDQAETVLAHLLRGTGLSGLAGIYPVRDQIIRPLLGARREDLRSWLVSLGQSWREDSTNTDTRRLRARLRIELLPLLTRDFQPQVVARLSALADLSRDEETFWSALVEERFRALTAASSPWLDSGAANGNEVRIADRIEVRIEVLIDDLLQPFAGLLPGFPVSAGPALSRRLLRRIVAAVAGDYRGITSTHVEQVLRLARESASGHRVMLPHGVRVERSFDRLRFSRSRATGKPDNKHGELGSPQETLALAAASYEYPVEIPAHGTTRVTIAAIHRRVCLKVVDWPSVQSDTSTLAEALDADLLHPPFLLRNWQPGDFYRPRGRQRARKVKFLFRERHIAASERRAWPVFTSGGRLAWVAGLPVAEEFAACRKTKVGLLISEEII